MPLETDLKKAYSLLYDQKLPLDALKLYDAILRETPECVPGLVYKAAALEKLYFGYADWHSDMTLENSVELLERALKVAQTRGDMSKLGFVYFRLFVHWFNVRKYDVAKTYFEKARECKYDEKMLEMWKFQLDKKLKKSGKNRESSTEKKNDHVSSMEATEDTKTLVTQRTAAPSAIDTTTVVSQVEKEPKPEPETELKSKFRTDWYQTAKTVTIVIYTQTLPETSSDVRLQLKDNRTLTVSYPILSKGSEFQYTVKLAGRVVGNNNNNNNNNLSCQVFSKKLEITLQKLDPGVSWHSLEFVETDKAESEKEKARVLEYPSSSKKATDWSRIGSSVSKSGEYDDYDEDEDAGSADAFFKKLYKNADPDTRRAMMKSFIESNGTALNTNWDDVKDRVVETVPPEGMELKHY